MAVLPSMWCDETSPVFKPHTPGIQLHQRTPRGSVPSRTHSGTVIMGRESAVVRLKSHLPAAVTGEKIQPQAKQLFLSSLVVSRSPTGVEHQLLTEPQAFFPFNSLGLKPQLEQGRGGHRSVSMTHVWLHATSSSGMGSLRHRQKMHRYECSWCHVCSACAHHLCFFLPAYFVCFHSGEKLSCGKKRQTGLMHYQTLYETVGGFSAQTHVLSLLHHSM